VKHGTNRIPNLLSWKYYSIVGLVFLSGLILMLIAEGHDNNWLRFIGEIGAFVAAAVASHFIYDRLIRKDEQLFLVEKLESSIEEKMRNFEKGSGIIKSESTGDIKTFTDGITSAKKRIWILTTWIGHLTIMEAPFRKAIQKGIKVDILLLNPKSIHAAERAKELGMENAEYVSREIYSNLDRLEQFAKESGYPSTLNVRLYEGHPVIHIQGFDDVIQLHFFLRKRNSLEAPGFILRDSAEEDLYFSNDVKNHFESISSNAKPVNFKDPDWRNKI
jgi:uncharacterized protein DUF5919